MASGLPKELYGKDFACKEISCVDWPSPGCDILLTQMD